jgi:hypothetical protein
MTRASAAGAAMDGAPFMLVVAGEMFERPGKLSDRLPSPYKNEQQARSSMLVLPGYWGRLNVLMRRAWLCCHSVIPNLPLPAGSLN